MQCIFSRAVNSLRIRRGGRASPSNIQGEVRWRGVNEATRSSLPQVVALSLSHIQRPGQPLSPSLSSAPSVPTQPLPLSPPPPLAIFRPTPDTRPFGTMERHGHEKAPLFRAGCPHRTPGHGKTRTREGPSPLVRLPPLVRGAPERLFAVSREMAPRPASNKRRAP